MAMIITTDTFVNIIFKAQSSLTGNEHQPTNQATIKHLPIICVDRLVSQYSVALQKAENCSPNNSL